MENITENSLQSIGLRLSGIEKLLSNSTKKVMNLDEVASYTNLSKSHLYKLTSTGGIPCYRPLGKHIYFEKDEIDNWLLQNKKATSNEIESLAATYTTVNKRGLK